MMREELRFHQRIRFGRPSRQGCDRISDEVVDLFFREAARRHRSLASRVACETLATTNRVIIAGEVRGSLDAKKLTRKSPRARRSSDRLRAGRLPLEEGQDRGSAARSVRRHRPGRRRLRQQGRGRGRSGHHVRLCLPRDAGADAGADLLFPQNPENLTKARKAREGAEKLGPTPSRR